MADTPKRSILNIFQSVTQSENMESLKTALDSVTAYDEADKAQLIDALEAHAIESIQGDVATKEDWDQVEEYIGVSNALMGGGDRSDDEALFPMHSILAIADKVADAKGEETAPLLKDMLETVSGLSNGDYHSQMTLSLTFIDVARKHTPSQKDLTSKPNPFRGKGYGGPHK